MLNHQIYHDIDCLGSELDALCDKWPELFPDDSFRKQRVVMTRRLYSLKVMIGKALSPVFRNAADAVNKFSVAINRHATSSDDNI